MALDGSQRGAILRLADAVAGEVEWLKLGLEAFTACGPGLVREVAERGCRVFLDLKLHDIPNTVARAMVNAVGAGADLLNVHAVGGRAMMTAAAAACRQTAVDRQPRLIAVTVLTSLDAGALAELGLVASPADLALRWARLARDCGLGGVVASAREAAAIRAACGPEFLIVTPGIRPSWAASDDQRRVMTPAEAARAGADILVVGRPVTSASDPSAAARRVHDELLS